MSKTIEITVLDRMMALELLQAINSKKKWTKQSIAKDARHLRLLRVKDKKSVIEIEAVLQYHCLHIRDTYHPQAFSAMAFRAKYERIKVASNV